MSTPTQSQEEQNITNSPMDLPYTGERHMTNQGQTFGQIEHMVRYGFAAGFVSGKQVLDITCGSGYGSQFLGLQGAQKVIGVDIDADAIAYAKKYHSHPVVEFIEGDAHALPQYADHSFDVIISFETIEHLQRPRDFLLELRRLLKPEGVAIISCPNDYRVSPWISEFHIHKFRFTEFKELVLNIFGNSAFLGQHNIIASALIKPVKPSVAASQFDAYIHPVENNLFAQQYLDYLGPMENADGYLAVSSEQKTILENLDNYISYSEMAFQGFVAYFKYVLETMQQSQSDHDFLQNQLNQNINALTAQIEDLRTQLCEKSELYENQLVAANSQLEQQQNEFKGMLQEYNDMRSQLEQQQNEFKGMLQEYNDMRSQLEIATNQTQYLQPQLETSTHQVELLNERIQAMESSKFWKMRQIWFALKRRLGVKYQ